MKNAFDFIWTEFSDFFESLEDIMPDGRKGRDFSIEEVSEKDREIIKELARRMAFALFFSEVDDGKEVL